MNPEATDGAAPHEECRCHQHLGSLAALCIDTNSKYGDKEGVGCKQARVFEGAQSALPLPELGAVDVSLNRRWALPVALNLGA